MSNSVDYNLIGILVILIISIVGWWYTARKDRRLVLNQYKYNMKAEKYSELSEDLEDMLTYLTIYDSVNLLDWENESNVKPNFIKLSQLSGTTTSEYLFNELHNFIDELTFEEAFTIENVEKMGTILIYCSVAEFRKSLNSYRIHTNRIDLIEPDNIVIKKNFEKGGINELLTDKLLRVSYTATVTIADMEGLIPAENPQEWINNIAGKIVELREVMKEDLKNTL